MKSKLFALLLLLSLLLPVAAAAQFTDSSVPGVILQGLGRYTVIPPASSGVPGFLTAADWAAFNAKLGIVTVDAPLAGQGTSASHLSIPDCVASGTGHARGTVPDPGASAGTTKFLREDCTFAVPSSTSGDMQATFDNGKTITNADSQAHAFRVGDATNQFCIYRDAALGLRIEPCTPADIRAIVLVAKTWGIYSDDLSADLLVVDPNANPEFAFAAGKTIRATASATRAGFRLGSYAGQPSSPVSGDLNNNAGTPEFYNGSVWKPLTRTIASGAKALATSAIGSAACSSAQTDTATGTLTTDVVTASFNGDPTAVTGYVPLTTGMLTIIVYPLADQVAFKICNNSNSSITPGALTLNWKVVR